MVERLVAKTLFPEMKPPSDLEYLLKQYGYSDKVINELWKWYDLPKEK